MRRLLALVPAALLVLTLAIPAQAGVLPTRTQACLPADPSTTGATAALTWDDSGTVDFSGAPILLLRSITVTNTCTLDYASVVVEHLSNDYGGVPSAIGPIQTFLDVPPGITKTLGTQGLTHLGLWQLPFTKWYVHVSLVKTGTTPCYVPGTANVADLFVVRANGSLITDPACPVPPASGQGTETAACPSNDGSTTGATLAVKWDNTGTVNYNDQPIMLLHQLTSRTPAASSTPGSTSSSRSM